MNNKGQEGLGAIIVVAITIIVGVILFTAIAQQSGSTTSLAYPNVTLDTVVNETAQYLTDYRSITDVVVQNQTGGVLITSGNYTITNNFIHPTSGALSVRIVPDTSADLKSTWFVSGTAQPLTYIPDAGGRAMVGLIAIFFALAVLVVALTPSLRGGLMDLIGKN